MPCKFSNDGQSQLQVAILSASRSIEGGAEVVLMNLLLNCGSGARVTLVSPAGCGVDQVARQRGIEWVELPAARDTFIGNTVGMMKVLKRLRHVDLFHAWTRRTFELAALAGWKMGKPCLATLHDHPQAAFISRWRYLLMYLAALRLGSIVCVSQYLRIAMSGSRLGQKAVVIPNGVDDFNPRAKRAVRASPPRVGFAGMHHLQKGFPMIASWAAKLLGDGVPVEFDLFGDVNPRWRQEALALEAKYPSRVRLRGRVSTKEVFDQIDILVQASYPFCETFGMVLAEAACAGIPSVTSTHGAEGEVVRDGLTGFLFKPDQPEVGLSRLLELVSNTQLRQDMGLAARQHFEQNLRAGLMVERYLSLWHKVSEPSMRSRINQAALQ